MCLALAGPEKSPLEVLLKIKECGREDVHRMKVVKLCQGSQSQNKRELLKCSFDSSTLRPHWQSWQSCTLSSIEKQLGCYTLQAQEPGERDNARRGLHRGSYKVELFE